MELRRAFFEEGGRALLLVLGRSAEAEIGSFQQQAPGVYRPRFTERATKLALRGGVEEKRLRLERDMLSQFRTAGAAFLERYSRTQIYFAAQHFGMPTRLLDWSTNPLAALFFACDGEPDEDGYMP